MTINIHTISGEVVQALNVKIEQYVKLYVKPKPVWCPLFVWKWVLNRVIVMQMTLPTFKVHNE